MISLRHLNLSLHEVPLCYQKKGLSVNEYAKSMDTQGCALSQYYSILLYD